MNWFFFTTIHHITDFYFHQIIWPTKLILFLSLSGCQVMERRYKSELCFCLHIFLYPFQQRKGDFVTFNKKKNVQERPHTVHTLKPFLTPKPLLTTKPTFSCSQTLSLVIGHTLSFARRGKILFCVVMGWNELQWGGVVSRNTNGRGCKDLVNWQKRDFHIMCGWE